LATTRKFDENEIRESLVSLFSFLGQSPTPRKREERERKTGEQASSSWRLKQLA
jgi:hypothetical protein